MWDKRLPTVIACVDETLRGVRRSPTDAPTDKEKTVTSTRICRIASPPHYPGANHRSAQPPAGPQTENERALLAFGEGAHQGLVEAAAAGAQRIRTKMARAVDFAAPIGRDTVDRALGLAGMSARFEFIGRCWKTD